MTEDERFAWLQLAFTPYIGAESFLLLMRSFGSAQNALSAPAEQVAPAVRHKHALEAWRNAEKRALARQAAEAALEWEMRDGCRLMLLQDEDFPEMLTQGLTAPPVLFLRGNVRLLHKPSAAIVGSRHATPQAMRIAKDFGRALGGKGIPTVSGMASGIDTAAHQGALEAEGGTVAVWGTGIDRIYPPANKNLAYEIAEKGLIVSEFPIGTRPYAGNFPRRNRLIAALSQVTLVVEAALESGSLITAGLAAEMGREVMAVPGSIDNPHSKGCHKLIKDGAKLTECLDDILNECPGLLQNTGASSYSINKDTPDTGRRAVQTAYAPPPAAKMPSEGAAGGTAVGGILDKMGFDPVHPDVLAGQLAMPAADLYAALLELELDGSVAAMPGGRYQRIRT
ncbi:TPA: DNA-protecting protein DprA [Neisseria gonorrhoeae]|uniref:DNA processing protein DprA n=1 Tax=Neisseria gonorrhoeae (strain ATCC 700825 / FA 1090) TaxID=242231 RepID=Q5F5Q2_NEIG1|nr:DNA-processing protein DprA [Neisseria gonorrhoeae]AAW90485.1 DNA processing protein DprA [Neisseria gonorrhoeae FA 1090]EFF40563.1 DNA processing protein [Neisseria gonorrhoeae F62]KAE9495038.1 DNA protecting protein DprA [Neisseria gonorrhoeae]KAE9499363.1 DNA protecting protein DprA [Neisseria gonorrhoeae]KAE9500552.1 DNA protecting protein DprA [Neisseria gonorrhoeae]